MNGVRKPRTLLFIVELLLIIAVVASAVDADTTIWRPDPYLTVHVTVSSPTSVALQARSVQRDNILDWDISSLRNLYVLTGYQVQEYDFATGLLVRTVELDSYYTKVRANGADGFVLMSGNSAHLLFVNTDAPNRGVTVPLPAALRKTVVTFAVASNGELFFPLVRDELEESYKYSPALGWSKVPWCHFLGADGLLYQYYHGVLHVFDGNGKPLYELSTIPFDPSPTYMAGMNSAGYWFLFTEPLGEKTYAVDTLEFMLLNPRTQTYGLFSIPMGEYAVRGNRIYSLRHRRQWINGQETVLNDWNPWLDTLFYWDLTIEDER